MPVPQYQQAKSAFETGGLPAVFLEVLGWDSRPSDKETFVIENVQYVGTKVASILTGIVVFEFDFSNGTEVTPNQQRQISKAVGRKYVERLVIFKTKSKSTWLWPKKTAGGALTYEKLEAPADTLPTFLAQRLVALSISNAEFDKGITPAMIREKLRGSFDTSNVTKKFYERFRNQHQDLAKAIKGLAEEQTHSYATLLLNRLMFIYFLQKKEFLNGDPNYLRNCLNKVTSLKGEGQFFSFYKDLLLELFFEGLNKKDGNFSPPEIASIIGKVPYINGGIFGESELEQNSDISVPDEIFEDIFNFFDSFTWHLDTRPTGNSDEINPEVIGYIFEQYINFTAGGKKENGAYYTKQDVTGYMVGQTLVPRVLDVLVETGLSPLQLTIGSGDRYISDSMLHGWSTESQDWEQIDSDLERVWLGDPIGWTELDDATFNPEISLPGESLVETFHRRERVKDLRLMATEGGLSQVNDLITHNLNSQLLLLDAIDAVDIEDDFKKIWNRLESLSVIDPTCGSGAFLFAALEVLEDVYAHLIDTAEELADHSAFAKQIVENVSTHANRRYYIRKQIALNNLYGTDLMSDAIETAKLRVFLALASCLDRPDEIEPLPDLDFNLKTGNLVVGFKDEDDAYRVGGTQIIGKSQIDALAPKIDAYVDLYAGFINDSKAGNANHLAKKELLDKAFDLRMEADAIYAECIGLPDDDLKLWREKTKPFHWFAEFPQIISRGGFDVIVGNPPYVKSSELNKTELIGYETLNTPDLFAICFERSLSLLSPTGRHSFIVMLSLAFSEKYGSLRKILAKRSNSEWWSTYGKRPDGLFTGVQVVNTIVILGPGHEVQVTKHNIFSKDSRESLFTTLEYGSISRSLTDAPHRSGIAANLVNRIKALRSVYQLDPNAQPIYIRPTARYWFPVLPGPLPLLDVGGAIKSKSDPGLKTTAAFCDENRRISIAALAGKVGYLFWSALGDDFHASTSETQFPRLLCLSFSPSERLISLADEVLTASRSVFFSTVNAGSQQVNIRWTGIRSVTDEFDRLLLQESGMLEEWRNLNIWYRQTMKSSGENANGRTLTHADIEALNLTW